MAVKSDSWIKEMAAQGMIEPFSPNQVREVEDQRIISYGLSSYGYDIRCASNFKIFTNIHHTVIDPKHVSEESLVTTEGNVCLIPPHSFALASSLERFKIPRDVLAICFGKSTYARCGVIVNVTPLEPEWEGYLTISISNTASLPVKIYAEEGIAQLLFLGADEICQTSYKDRNGKYQDQHDITLSKL